MVIINTFIYNHTYIHTVVWLENAHFYNVDIHTLEVNKNQNNISCDSTHNLKLRIQLIQLDTTITLRYIISYSYSYPHKYN